ncbi:hypothetical protein PSPO01_13886 [Paraphaeosphaeria sporulosa]
MVRATEPCSRQLCLTHPQHGRLTPRTPAAQTAPPVTRLTEPIGRTTPLILPAPLARQTGHDSRLPPRPCANPCVPRRRRRVRAGYGRARGEAVLHRQLDFGFVGDGGGGRGRCRGRRSRELVRLVTVVGVIVRVQAFVAVACFAARKGADRFDGCGIHAGHGVAFSRVAFGGGAGICRRCICRTGVVGGRVGHCGRVWGRHASDGIADVTMPRPKRWESVEEEQEFAGGMRCAYRFSMCDVTVPWFRGRC